MKMNTAPLRCNRAFDRAMREGRQHQRGLTLIELMVSIAIGLFIVLVATTIYVQGLSTVSFRAGQSENLNNSRYALSVLDNEFSKAGYRRNPLQKMNEAFPADAAPGTNQCQFAVGQALYAPTVTSVCMRYQARDNNETDCAGVAANIAALKPYESPVGTAGLFSERYSLVNGKLICQSGGADGTTVAVADGVADVLFEFGVESIPDPGKPRHVDVFKTDVPDPGEVIRSLRYAVLLASSGRNVTQGMTSSVCTRWADAGGTASSCDTSRGQLYQLATGSVSLRNLMP